MQQVSTEGGLSDELAGCFDGMGGNTENTRKLDAPPILVLVYMTLLPLLFILINYSIRSTL
jgi:hypothetical protein